MNIAQLAADLFLKDAVQNHIQKYHEADNKIKAALTTTQMSHSERTSTVREWLRTYSVLQGLTDEARSNVAAAIVDYADSARPKHLSTDPERIFEQFEQLHSMCSKAIPLTKKGKPRTLTSLASKALWCCYPDVVPIYDSQAVSALSVLSRLMEIDEPDDGKPLYRRYVEVWFACYSRVTIPDAELGGFPHKVRVFDKVLWQLGRGGFGLAASTESDVD